MLRIENLSMVYPPAEGFLKFLMRTASDTPVEALSEVSFEVDSSQVVGLVGSNGAGKTTLFRIIATLLDATSGHVFVDGYDTRESPEEVRKRLGLILEGERGIYQRLTGLDNLEFFGVMQGMTKSKARERGSELMERLGLSHRDRRVFGYSAGMRVRLALARSLLPDPRLLLLDEPTRSLDPNAAAEAMGLLAELAGSGRAVLLASHRLDEVRAFCDKVVVIRSGKVRFIGPPGDIDLVAMMSEDVEP